MSKKICIFCGAHPGNSPAIIEQAMALCALLIDRDYDLVYGGGESGLMGVIANQFLARGRRVIGIRPRKLIADEAAHHGLSELVVVEDMFERKAEMMALSDAFIALPGGAGTLVEMLEVYTQVKIGYLHKFCGVLNTDNYYLGLTILLDNMVAKGFLRTNDQAALCLRDTPEELVAALTDFF